MRFTFNETQGSSLTEQPIIYKKTNLNSKDNMIDKILLYVFSATAVYYCQARFFPTFFGLLPLIIQLVGMLLFKANLWFDLSAGNLRDLFYFLCTIAIIVVITIIPLVQLSVIFSRHVVQWFYFREGELSMPTTYMLMEENSIIPLQIKKRIKEAIESEFHIIFLSKKEEEYNPDDQKRLIVAAVKQIREKTRSDKILLGKNTRYGGLRNFLGGYLCGSLLLALTVLFWPLSELTLVVLVLTTVLAISGSLLYKKVAEDYADSLFSSFLNQMQGFESKQKTILVET